RRLDQLRLDAQLGRAAADRAAILPLAGVAGEGEQRHLVELVLRALPRVGQLDAEPIGDHHLERYLVLGGERRLQVLVAELRLRRLTVVERPHLVLGRKARTAAGRAPSRAQLEIVDQRNVEPALLAEPPRAGDAVVVVLALVRAEHGAVVAAEKSRG